MTSRRLLGSVACAVVGAGLVTVSGATSVPSPTATAESASPATGPTVLVGVGALRWSDLGAEETPTLWSLIGHGSVASISVRTVRAVTCPLDAWLTVSTGQRSLGSPSDAETAACPPIPPVNAGTVTGWRYLVNLQRDEVSSYGEPGVLADQLGVAGDCALAVGPGAAVAAATSTGRVTDYVPRLASADLGTCGTTVIDGGVLPPGPPDRAAALRELDARVHTVLDRLPEDAELIVAGIADQHRVAAALEPVIAYDGSGAQTWLTSGSTRRTGLIQLTDLSATALARAGISDPQIEGAAVEQAGLRHLDTAGTVANRLDLGVLTQVAPSVTPWLEATLAAAQAAVYAAAFWHYRRRRGRDLAPYLGLRWRKLVVATAIGAACVPVASYLATLTSWWTYTRPTIVLVAVLAAIVVVLTLVASRPPGVRLRGEIWGPALVVSATTFTVLTLDALSGTPLQLGSVLSSNPVGGGRFFGFGNITFAVYAASAFMLAGCLHQLLRGSGPRPLPFVVAGAVALLALVVDGWPGFGADLGGVISLGPGFALMLIGLTRVQLSWKRLLLLVALGPVLATSVAVVDWLRPAADRTHLGRFVQRVVDGQATDVVLRKGLGVLDTITTVPGVLTVLATGLAVAIALRPARWGFTTLSEVYRRWPAASPLVRGAALVAVLGSITNDSGVVVAGAILLTTAPLVVVACLRAAGEPT